MSRLFDDMYKKVMLLSESDFSQVVTHNYENKESVKLLQNDFITQRIQQRSRRELMVCVVGNPEGLEAHIQEYGTLGFSPGQIIIFERQPQTAAALIEKAIELGYKTTPENVPISHPNFYNELKVFTDTFSLDLKRVDLIASMLPLITHIDFDGTDFLNTAEEITDGVDKCFSNSSVQSLVVVHTINRNPGGIKTPTTNLINTQVNQLLQQTFTYRPFGGTDYIDLRWSRHGERPFKKIVNKPLKDFLDLAAQERVFQASSKTDVSTDFGFLKSMLKRIISNTVANDSSINVAYKDILANIQRNGNVSTLLVPYTGLANMFSITSVRDNSNTAELNMSLKREVKPRTNDSLIKTINKIWPFYALKHKDTGVPFEYYLHQYIS
jgi:hypothetical protein